MFSPISSQNPRLMKYLEHFTLNIDNCRHVKEKTTIKTRNLKAEVGSTSLIIQAILKTWQK